MPLTTSLALAQLLSLAISSAYGLAFLGLWLQFRRRSAVAFAIAWLGLALSSVAVAAFVPATSRLNVQSAGVMIATGSFIVAGLLFVNAALVTVERERAARRLLVWIAPIAGLLLLALFAASGRLSQQDFASVIRIIGIASLFTASAIVWKAPPFAGRTSALLAFAFQLARIAAGLLLERLAPDLLTSASQPTAFTMFQVLTTLLAGFFTTSVIFAAEREATIRERLTMERALAAAQRMESLGRMSASVAHDFNNILGAVLGSAEFAALPNASVVDREEAARDIEQAVGRGKALTDRLLAFARPMSREVESYDPVQRARELLPMVQRLAGTGVTVSLDDTRAGSADNRSVRGDPVQFDQVLLNLTANARDAMPDGGRVRIECERLDGNRGGSSGRGHPSQFTLRVADSGAGIPLALRDRIFEPFFTTKGDGDGTGLGLATAYAFAQASGGSISVESVEGQGSTFCIELPLIDKVA